MYKLLITARYVMPGACSIVSVVVEFDTVAEANIAAKNVDDQTSGVSYSVVKLYNKTRDSYAH